MQLADRPLKNVEEWDDYVKERYRPDKAEDEFRDYDGASQAVKEFYRQNHECQTLEAARTKHEQYVPMHHESCSMWETLERLNKLVDESDPDTDVPQIAHALQTAEKIRSDGHPDWMQLTGLVHDTGKMLCFFGEPQWAVVGDTFPLGCEFSDKIVYREYFEANPDSSVPKYQTELGIYEEGCGLGGVTMSWGHDEYAFETLRESKLPAESLAMLRYHSFYPWHRDGAYRRLMDLHDEAMLPWVQEFNQYDLYSKSDAPPNVAELRPYYQGLIDKYLPATINW